jgi:hypothetical protein
MLARFGFVDVTEGGIVILHLLELMYDGWVEFVLVGEMTFKVVAC